MHKQANDKVAYISEPFMSQYSHETYSQGKRTCEPGFACDVVSRGLLLWTALGKLAAIKAWVAQSWMQLTRRIWPSSCKGKLPIWQ